MVRFYDARNMDEIAKVEQLLKQYGVEYFLTQDPTGSSLPEVLVAEEDVPFAEDLVRRLLH